MYVQVKLLFKLELHSRRVRFVSDLSNIICFLISIFGVYCIDMKVKRRKKFHNFSLSLCTELMNSHKTMFIQIIRTIRWHWQIGPRRNRCECATRGAVHVTGSGTSLLEIWGPTTSLNRNLATAQLHGSSIESRECVPRLITVHYSVQVLQSLVCRCVRLRKSNWFKRRERKHNWSKPVNE